VDNAAGIQIYTRDGRIHLLFGFASVLVVRQAFNVIDHAWRAAFTLPPHNLNRSIPPALYLKNMPPEKKQQQQQQQQQQQSLPPGVVANGSSAPPSTTSVSVSYGGAPPPSSQQQNLPPSNYAMAPPPGQGAAPPSNYPALGGQGFAPQSGSSSLPPSHYPNVNAPPPSGYSNYSNNNQGAPPSSSNTGPPPPMPDRNYGNRSSRKLCLFVFCIVLSSFKNRSAASYWRPDGVSAAGSHLHGTAQ
jgi:hypothetical protein